MLRGLDIYQYQNQGISMGDVHQFATTECFLVLDQTCAVHVSEAVVLGFFVSPTSSTVVVLATHDLCCWQV